MCYCSSYLLSEGLRKILRELIGKEDGAMLPAGAAIADTEKAKTSAEVILYCIGDKAKGELTKSLYLWILYEVLDHILVEAGELFVSSFTTRVWQTPAVENESSSVSAIFM